MPNPTTDCTGELNAVIVALDLLQQKQSQCAAEIAALTAIVQDKLDAYQACIGTQARPKKAKKKPAKKVRRGGG